ncbi:MAG TPA: FAD-dependent oxidoreductase, partial [Clostridia bacterium]
LPRVKGSSRKEAAVTIVADNGEWFEVPMGVIIPRGIDNMFVAGKAISADSRAQSALGLAQMMVLGQAAGISAAMVSQRKMRAKDIDGRLIRSILDELGCDIDGDKTRSYFGDVKSSIYGINI